MTAQTMVEAISKTGVSLWLDGANLRFKPIPDSATIELLRQHKAEIVSFLSIQISSDEIAGSGKPENETPLRDQNFSEENKIPATPAPEVQVIPSPGHLEELRGERASIQEYDGSLSEDEAEARATLAYPCTCGGRRYWVSVYGAIRCGACHPPAQENLVKRWIDLL